MFDCEPSEILLKTLQLFFIAVVVPGIIVGNCLRSKKKKPEKRPVAPSSRSKTVSQKEDDKTQKNSVKEISDAKFNIDTKQPQKKYDEFDDDEVNPLAFLPVKPRVPKPPPSAITPTASVTPTKTPVVTAKMGPRMVTEKPLFPTTDSGAPKSCYVNLS